MNTNITNTEQKHRGFFHSLVGLLIAALLFVVGTVVISQAIPSGQTATSLTEVYHVSTTSTPSQTRGYNINYQVDP